MESTLQKPANLHTPGSKGIGIAFWIVTAIFCLTSSPASCSTELHSPSPRTLPGSSK